tara:strand:+ start:19938 stop:21203 length:1266 start_codon:yes stop_codon:yes gene_type:complete
VKFNQWKIWLKSKPWLLKWFILLVLVRPIIDNLYFLKNISPFLSPLYITGVLTPLMVIYVLAKTKKPASTKLDRHMRFFSFFLLLGTFFVIVFDPLSMESFEYLLKLSLPVYMYFFARRFIQSKEDLDGILTTFLYSSIFVAGILMYEVVINPIRVEESRGMGRIQGSFGDVVSYGIYLLFSFLIACYFYFSKRKLVPMRKRLRTLLIVAAFALLALVNIHHIASYTIFVLILLLFLVYNFKTNKAAAFGISLMLFSLFIFFGQPIIEEKITPLLETDVAVFEGEQESGRLLHGRVGRWEYMAGIFTDQNIFVQFFGYPFTLKYSYHFVGVGSHSDYVRILFLSGYFGLYAYLLVLFSFFKRAKQTGYAQRFLAYGLLAIILLYSISVVPTYYPPFVYMMMCIFAYIALPFKMISKKVINE